MKVKLIKPSQFKRIEKEMGANIVAQTYLEPYAYNTNHEFYKLKYDGKDYLAGHNLKGKVLGYLEVGHKSYIEVKKKPGTAIFRIIKFFEYLIAGALGLFLVLFFLGAGLHVVKNIMLNSENATETDNSEVEVEEGYIAIPTLAPTYQFTTHNDVFQLSNPANNTVSMKYCIYADDGVITETSWLNPGGVFDISVMDVFGEVGEYKVQILVQTKDIETKQTCNGAILETTFYITED